MATDPEDCFAKAYVVAVVIIIAVTTLAFASYDGTITWPWN